MNYFHLITKSENTLFTITSFEMSENVQHQILTTIKYWVLNIKYLQALNAECQIFDEYLTFKSSVADSKEDLPREIDLGLN